MRDDVYVGMLVSRDSLKHYGKGHDDNPPGRGSGRYAWGSGKNPKQTEKKNGPLEGAQFYLFEEVYLFPAIELIKDHLAEKRIKERNERVKNEQVDKSTGFHLKDREYSISEDVKHSNPGFGSMNQGFSNNCMLCTTTYDLRRRGYDVAAVPDMDGRNWKDIKRWYSKPKTYEIDYTEEVGKKGWRKAFANELREELVSQGEGARGNLEVDWKPGLFDVDVGGHSMVYEVQDGQLYIRDAQTGNTNVNLDKLLKRIKPYVDYTRLDNLNIKSKGIKECCR